MALPHFSNMKFNYYDYDTVQQSSVEVIFDDLILLNNCCSIDKCIMKFNFLLDNKDIIPYHTIKKMIDNKDIIRYLEIKHYDKSGKLLYSIFLNKFRFVKILNMLDFDWSKFNEIKDLKVIFKYEKEYVVTEGSQYEKFKRKIKLEKINDL